MDWHAFDIGRCRQADIEHGPTSRVVCAPTLRPAIGVVQVERDVGRVKQHNHVLRQVARMLTPSSTLIRQIDPVSVASAALRRRARSGARSSLAVSTLC
jgi:hypothetical protein